MGVQRVDLALWDACIDHDLSPLLTKTNLPIWAGLDLGLKHDSTALVACARDGDRIRVVTHQIFVPKAGETLDIEGTAEAAVLSLRSRFDLRCLWADPWQGINLLQRLQRAGINAVEWPQTTPNLSLMAGNLLELIKRRQLVCYPADDLRQAVAKTVAIESSRGWRLGKAKASDRVDPVIALAMSALATVQAAAGAAGFDQIRQYYASLPRGDAIEDVLDPRNVRSGGLVPKANINPFRFGGAFSFPGKAKAPFCHRCNRPIADGQEYQRSQGGPWSDGQPLLAHTECARRAMGGGA